MGEKEAYEPRCRRHFDPAGAAPPREASAVKAAAPRPTDSPAPVED